MKEPFGDDQVTSSTARTAPKAYVTPASSTRLTCSSLPCRISSIVAGIEISTSSSAYGAAAP